MITFLGIFQPDSTDRLTQAETTRSVPFFGPGIGISANTPKVRRNYTPPEREDRLAAEFADAEEWRLAPYLYSSHL